MTKDYFIFLKNTYIKKIFQKSSRKRKQKLHKLLTRFVQFINFYKKLLIFFYVRKLR